MSAKAQVSQSYIVASTDGSWHYAPVDSITPEDAVRASEPDAECTSQVDSEYDVYELVSKDPVRIVTRVGLARR